MKKPALREKRFQPTNFQETEWTASSKDIGEYIYRRISIETNYSLCHLWWSKVL